MKFLFFLNVFLLLALGSSAQLNYKLTKITKDVELIQVSPSVYVHTSYFDDPVYGRFASNGLLVVDGKKAILFDTPVSELVTQDLISWIHYSMKLRVTRFVATHWHSDRMGGLAYLHKIGVVSYAHHLTIEITKQKNLPIPINEFTDSLVLHTHAADVCCYFFGAAHSSDNIVIWFPKDKILFGGCMVKSLDSQNLGNTIDADLKQWPQTIMTVRKRFANVQIVIPGHGSWGDSSLLAHTSKLLEK